MLLIIIFNLLITIADDKNNDLIDAVQTIRKARSFVHDFSAFSFWTLLVGVLLLSTAIGVPLSEARPLFKSAPRNGLKKNGRARHLYLFSLAAGEGFEVGDEAILDWDGPYGKLNVNEMSLTYSFNGKFLHPETEYALVQYLGDVTGNREDIWIVGLGLSNGNGDLHISGDWQPWLGRFWLVLGEDVVGEADGATVLDRLVSWNPAEYLFEYGEF